MNPQIAQQHKPATARPAAEQPAVSPGPSAVQTPAADIGDGANAETATAMPFYPAPWWKRGFDISVAVFCLTIMSPVFLGMTILIKCVSSGPVFFRQKRYGARGEPFMIYKFRTMHEANNTAVHEDYVRELRRNGGTVAKIDSNAPLIPLARIVRGLGVDEFPQVLNVLWGDMSIIGPRPDVMEPSGYQPEHRQRFEVTPGVTGLWQVSGKNRTTFDQMMELDCTYVRRRSLGLDAWILFRTPFAVLNQLLFSLRN